MYKTNIPNPVTYDLSDAGMREIKMVRDLLDAWIKSGLPEDFYEEGVKPAMNSDSGYVFLTNDEYQVAMMNGKKLESWYTTPDEGREGFFEDLVREYPHMTVDDQEYLYDVAEATGRESKIPFAPGES